ncbi:BCCT family transporter [Vibrio tapetis]|uniref:Choline transporter n=1 Tax=Vibrio tapetis subsp. tapetis TaxID=1671868 RepID=A0A2N8ZHC5_9VIBR|nr:BCCT family transporter [Vibrio tapetis]SON51313.1 Choline transporter [Vibrio tapetis subsp. tapetis]
MKSFSKWNMDVSLLIPSIIIVFSSCAYLAMNPMIAGEIINLLFGWVTSNFGWLYLLTGISCLGVMLYLAFSRYGNIRLGRENDTPDFKKSSWISMLFCAGIGISLCNWAFIEPIYIMASPPLDIEAGTSAAIEWGAMYPLLHWGVVPWAIYLLPALPMAYNFYVRRVPIMRFSEACRPVLKGLVDGPIGKVIDLIVIISIIGAVGTSLGLSVPLVTSLLDSMFGIGDSLFVQFMVLASWIVMIGWSVYSGLGKGIQILSNINMVLALLLLAFVLFAGPTLFILQLSSNSLGLFLDNFFRVNTWTSPIDQDSFPSAWTIFYWAWWVAYAPMMGIFVATISKGRTIREFILNGVLWGAAGTSVFFMVWGGYSLHLDMTGTLAVADILNSEGIPKAVTAIVNNLPWSSIIAPLFIILCFIFLATTVDSSAYTLALITSKKIKINEEPTRMNRAFWTLTLAFVGVGLLTVGGLKSAQTSTLVAALPMIPVILIMVVSFFRMLKQDFPEISTQKHVVLDGEGMVVVEVEQHTEKVAELTTT